jgi:hypothetical protein
VQQNTSPTGWRRAGFSGICVESVMAALNMSPDALRFPQNIKLSLQ